MRPTEIGIASSTNACFLCEGGTKCNSTTAPQYWETNATLPCHVVTSGFADQADLTVRKSALVDPVVWHPTHAWMEENGDVPLPQIQEQIVELVKLCPDACRLLCDLYENSMRIVLLLTSIRARALTHAVSCLSRDCCTILS